MRRIQDRILAALEDLDRPLSPLELAKIIGANPDSVRSRLSKMLKAGLILRPFPRHYGLNPTTGVGSPPKIQNLQVIARRSKNPELFKRVMSHESVRTHPSPPGEEFSIRVEFGQKRHQINYTVKAPCGLDYYGLLSVHAYAEEVVRRRTGLTDLNWDVIKFDWLRDFMREQLEGVSVYTIDDLKGTMLKFYNKFYGIRQEVTISPEATRLEELVNIMSGGIPQYQMTGYLALLTNKIEGLTSAFGAFLQRKEKSDAAMEAISESQFRVLNLLDEMEKRIRRVEKDE
jgi:DNA-binding Lrp family transcriptional regulator